jgi:P27 family predicted phage terminase small subunit
MTRRVPDGQMRAGHRKLKVAPAPPPREIPLPDFVRLLGTESGPIALAEWQRVVPLLRKMGSASALDAYLLREYCVCFARTLAAEEQITREGLMVAGQRAGSMVKHPLVSVSNAYRNASRTICTQLGIGANVRGQMNLTPPKEPKPEAGGWLPERVK